MVVLEKEYTDGDFLRKIVDLGTKYSHLRRTRGDGNCFYRAFGFGYLEQLYAHPAELARVYLICKDSLDRCECMCVIGAC